LINVTGVYTDCFSEEITDDYTNGGRNTTLSLIGSAFVCGPGSVPPNIELGYTNYASGTCSCPNVLSASGSIVIAKLGSCGTAECFDYPFWKTTAALGGGIFSSAVGLLQFNFADSANCGGTNPSVQKGTACTVVDGEAGGKVISVSGNIEHQTAGFDCITVKIDGITVINICSNGDGAGCSMESRSGSAPIPAGPGHVIDITISTVDGLFHKGAFWQASII
jgi:hypothetical protein